MILLKQPTKLTTRCPLCKQAVPPEARDCPYCPASFEDDYLVSSRKAYHPEFKAAACLMLIAALSYGVWQGLDFVMKYAYSYDSSRPAPIHSAQVAPEAARASGLPYAMRLPLLPR